MLWGPGVPADGVERVPGQHEEHLQVIAAVFNEVIRAITIDASL